MSKFVYLFNVVIITALVVELSSADDADDCTHFHQKFQRCFPPNANDLQKQIVRAYAERKAAAAENIRCELSKSMYKCSSSLLSEYSHLKRGRCREYNDAEENLDWARARRCIFKSSSAYNYASVFVIAISFFVPYFLS